MYNLPHNTPKAAKKILQNGGKIIKASCVLHCEHGSANFVFEGRRIYCKSTQISQIDKGVFAITKDVALS